MCCCKFLDVATSYSPDDSKSWCRSGKVTCWQLASHGVGSSPSCQTNSVQLTDVTPPISFLRRPIKCLFENVGSHRNRDGILIGAAISQRLEVDTPFSMRPRHPRFIQPLRRASFTKEVLLVVADIIDGEFRYSRHGHGTSK